MRAYIVIGIYDEKQEGAIGYFEKITFDICTPFSMGEYQQGLVAQAKCLALTKSFYDPERPSIIIYGAPDVACSAISSVTGTSYVIIITEPTVSGLYDLERELKW